jgi:hypothetical protein
MEAKEMAGPWALSFAEKEAKKNQNGLQKKG